jgi:hypothetical protein
MILRELICDKIESFKANKSPGNDFQGLLLVKKMIN